MTTKADEMYHSALAKAEAAEREEAYRQALTNERDLLKAQIGTSQDRGNHERRIKEIAEQLGEGRSAKRTATREQSGAKREEGDS